MEIPHAPLGSRMRALGAAQKHEASVQRQRGQLQPSRGCGSCQWALSFSPSQATRLRSVRCCTTLFCFGWLCVLFLLSVECCATQMVERWHLIPTADSESLSPLLSYVAVSFVLVTHHCYPVLCISVYQA